MAQSLTIAYNYSEFTAKYFLCLCQMKPHKYYTRLKAEQMMLGKHQCFTSRLPSLQLRMIWSSKLHTFVRVNSSLFKFKQAPQLVWLSGLDVILQTKRSRFQFPVRAHPWVAGQGPSWGHARGNRSKLLSLSFSLPSPLSTNK